jgi:hypothetical protein
MAVDLGPASRKREGRCGEGANGRSGNRS